MNQQRIRAPRRSLMFRMMNLAVRLLPVSPKFHSNLIIMRKDLGEPAGRDLNFKGVVFCEAGPGDIRYMNSQPETRRPEVHANRLKAGHACYCLKKAGDIVSFVWVSQERAGSA